MTRLWSRRDVLATSLLLPFSRAAGATESDPWTTLERAASGRLGVMVLDPTGARAAAHRASERFPLCSTFKLLAAAAVLQAVDRGDYALDESLALSADDLVEYSPVTKDYVAAGRMTVEQACDAALTASDNTAGNLLLRRLGGPAALTQWLRAHGDSETRLDRWETALNEARPGDPRDTTTPRAMGRFIHRWVLGDELAAPSRDRLQGWMRANRTGDARLRAGLAAGWSAAEKTGAGAHGTNNDVGVLYTPDRRPWVVAAYLTGSTASFEARNDTLAGVARAVIGLARA